MSVDLSDFMGVVALSADIFKTYRAIHGIEQRQLRRNYGWVISLLVITFTPELATHYTRLEQDVLRGSTESVSIFRQSVINDCNITAVVGAILSQVAITGLSLENLSSTHWMARALLLFAVASGCFSVYCACIVQGTVGKLYNPERLKDWIRLPPPPGPSTRKPHDPHSVSLAAVLILSAPLTLVDYSLFSFLIGLAVYQGFIWTQKLDLNAGNGDSRDVFITYVVGFGACLLFYAFALSTKMIENLLRRGRMSGWDQNIIMEDMHLSPAQQQYAQSLQHLSLPAVAENANARVNLATALELAAQAHEQCAEADRRVALLFQQSRDDLHDLPHPIQR